MLHQRTRGNIVGGTLLNILGIGNDLCDGERMAGMIRRYGQRFLDTTFTQAEQALARRLLDPPLFYAERFAAKEAFLKALGTGLAENVLWTDIEILVSPAGLPVVTLAGEALTQLPRPADGAGAAANVSIHVSISHEARLAAALVILEARRRPQPALRLLS